MTKEVEVSKIERHTLEERTLFELFGSDKAEEPLLKIEYPGIIYLELGDSVNVHTEKDSKEGRILGHNGIPMPRGCLFFPPHEYVVKKSKKSVNMSLDIRGKKNPLTKYYTLVRVKGSY